MCCKVIGRNNGMESFPLLLNDQIKIIIVRRFACITSCAHLSTLGLPLPEVSFSGSCSHFVCPLQQCVECLEVATHTWSSLSTIV